MNKLNRLHDTQRGFSRCVFEETGTIPAGIKANGLTPEQRLTIYRNNTRAGLTEALRDVYPVVNNLVGDAFFNRLAEAYIKDYPPRAACLLTFGGQFAEVIAGFQAAQGLPYLPDTARLEWLWHEAYHEADGERLDIAALAQLDVGCYEQLGFNLHPTARFIASDYPIARIWQANQRDGQDNVIRLDEGGCRLLVYRPALEVEMIILKADEFAFLTVLAAGQTLTQAALNVVERFPEFDIQAALQHWLLKGLISDFFIIQQGATPATYLTF